MRHESKMWDNAPNKPLRLKQRLAEMGRSHKWLAEMVTKKGYKISRVTMWGVINKQYRTSDYDRLKKIVEDVLTQNKVAITGIWQYLPGAEYKMGRMRPHGNRHRQVKAETHGRASVLKDMKGGEEMNYTKSYLDEEVLRHFGLESDPFFDVLDFTDIWISPRLKVVERRVYDTVRRHGIMAIVGDIGAGKTTFLRYVLTKMLKEKTVKIIYPDLIDRKQLNGSAFTPQILPHGLRHPAAGHVLQPSIRKRYLPIRVSVRLVHDQLISAEFDCAVIIPQMKIPEVIDDGLRFKAKAQYKPIETVFSVDAHHVPQDRVLADRHHRFGAKFRLLLQPRA